MNDINTLKQQLTVLVPEQTVIDVSLVTPCGFELHPDERALTGKMAAKRLADFRASRYVASNALSQLGHSDFAILINQQRGPIWPPGIIGSLSHCSEIAVAVAIDDRSIASIGIDVEAYYEMEENLRKLICSEQEMKHLRSIGQPELMSKIVFSIKEAIYKCLNPLIQQWIDFKDVSIVLDKNKQTYVANLNSELTARLGCSTISGRWLINEQHVYSSCWIKQKQLKITTFKKQS
jgi:4'-phosphopantetheinyl transferase EntD